jgi:cytoskeletal protein CcmA (bactofilin family)
MARGNINDEFTKPTGTVIGKGYTIHAARFACSDSESMKIDGTVIGNIEIDGVILLSESGRVDGNISANSCNIAGRVSGNIACRYALKLAPTADVTGDILTTVLVVDDGAIFLGRCQTHVADESTVFIHN